MSLGIEITIKIAKIKGKKTEMTKNMKIEERILWTTKIYPSQFRKVL